MFLKSLTLSNILSFGPEPHTVELGPLNVIIGPNGSGKSNFIEAIGLLKAAPRDIREPIREGGGVDEWIWKGKEDVDRAIVSGSLGLDNFHSNSTKPYVKYTLKFDSVFDRFEIDEEEIGSVFPERFNEEFHVKGGRIVFKDYVNEVQKAQVRFDPDQSILSQRQMPFDAPDLGWLEEFFKLIQIHREISTAKRSPIRLPQKTDLPNMFLAHDAGNLGLVINRLRRDVAVRHSIRKIIQDLYDGIEDVDVQIEGGTAQIFIYEGQIAVSAARLSDGTLRFLCLLAILCHPEPPPLICIEEPELGLHPDLIPAVSRLLKEASERTQIIVTTHSDILVDTMTDCPEAVLVAEKGEGGTRLTRLDPEQMKPWLEKYRLGDLWTSGQLGGTRW